MTYFDLLPCALYKEKFSISLTPKQRVILDYIKTEENGFSKEFHLLNTEEFKSLKEEAYIHIKRYEKDVCGFKKDLKLKITESWYRETVPHIEGVRVPNNNHEMHNHPNSLLSGCIYLNVPDQPSDVEIPEWDGKGHDGINFVHKEGRGIFKNFNFEYDHNVTKYNSTNSFLKVESGDIILFPSYIDHFVSHNLSKTETRKIISFNTFIEGDMILNNPFPNQLSLKKTS